MKPKTLIVLLVLLVACVVFIVVKKAAQNSPANVTPSGNVSKPLFEHAFGEVSKLAIAPEGRQRLSFVREGSRWRMVEPSAAKASELRVNDVIGAIKNLKAARSFTPGKDGQADDAMTGLDKPSFIVTLTEASGAVHTISVGKGVPFASPAQTYVRPGGESKTFVAEADLSQLLLTSAADYRDKNVLSVPVEQAVRVSVEGQQSFELQKIDGAWSVTKPISARADQIKANALLNKLRNVMADRFLPENPSPSALAMYELAPGKEQAVVRIWTQAPPPAIVPLAASEPTSSSAPATTPASAPATASAPAMQEHALAIGKQVDNRVYAKLLDGPAVFMLNASILSDIQPKLADIRDRKLLTFTSDNVEQIDIAVPMGSAKLVNINGQWKFVSPVVGPAGALAVNKLLSTLSSLQASDFPESQQALAIYGLENPKTTITLHLKGKSETIGLAVGSATKTGEMTFVAPLASSSVAVVRSLDVQPVLLDPAGYYDPQLLMLNRDNVQSLSIARKDGTFALKRDGLKWMLLSPGKADADAGSVETIISGLSSMAAIRIAAMGPQVTDRYAKAADAITVEVTTAIPASAAAPATASAPTTETSQPATAPAPATASAPSSVSQKTVVHVVKLGTSVYAWIDGAANNPVGEFPPSLYDSLWAELRSRTVWDFEPGDVTGVKIFSAKAATKPAAAPEKETVELKKDQDTWSLSGDQYVKIDPAKVTTYLAQLKGIKAERFTSTAPDAQDKVMKDAASRVELTLTGGKTLVLAIGKGEAARPAASSAVQGVFELSSASADMLVKSWKDFQQTEAPAKSPAGMPPMGGMGGSPIQISPDMDQ